MNAPTLAQSTENDDLVNKFIGADASTRQLVLEIWMSILVDCYRDLVKELQAFANYSPDVVATTITRCQEKLKACPEYKYIEQYGDQHQIARVQGLLASLQNPLPRAKHIEPVTLIWPSIAELRYRVRATLAQIS